MTRIQYPSPAPTRRHFAALPQAHIEIVQHDDGRWMWATSFFADDGGASYAAMPKWGRFAPTEDAARAAGIAEMRERLAQRSWAGKPQALALLTWLESLEAPAQGTLFG